MRKDEFPIVDKLVKDSINEVLDKIQAEATSLKISYTDHDKDTYRRGVNDVVKIIDRYISGKERE